MNVASKLLIGAMLMVSACSTPKLPDPTFRFPKPPEQLMVPPEPLKPIPEKSDGEPQVSSQR